MDRFIDYITVFSEIVADVGVEYFKKGTDITIEVNNGDLLINRVDGIFEKGINEKAILLKLEHNIQMVKSFAQNYPADTKYWDFDDFMLKDNDNLRLKLHLDTSSVNVTEKKGYGLFTTNLKKLIATLTPAPHAIESYISEIAKKKEMKYLERILKFELSKLPSESTFDDVMEAFVQENKDFFSK